MEQYKAYLGLTGDMGFSLEATSEEEAITTALKKAAELLSDEKAQKFYLDNFVKLEVISVNDKKYHYPQSIKVRDILHGEAN